MEQLQARELLIHRNRRALHKRARIDTSAYVLHFTPTYHDGVVLHYLLFFYESIANLADV